MKKNFKKIAMFTILLGVLIVNIFALTTTEAMADDPNPPLKMKYIANSVYHCCTDGDCMGCDIESLHFW